MNYPIEADFEHRLIQLIRVDSVRMTALKAVRSLQLPDCWIGAGFIRNFVWSHLHGQTPLQHEADIDVIWFGAEDREEETDRAFEAQLQTMMPDQNWSVKNQARMHIRNGDLPYSSCADAMRHWPETATAIAIRLADDGDLQCNVPFGLSDLFTLQLNPTPHFQANKPQLFPKRVKEKGWLRQFPLVQMQFA